MTTTRTHLRHVTSTTRSGELIEAPGRKPTLCLTGAPFVSDYVREFEYAAQALAIAEQLGYLPENGQL